MTGPVPAKRSDALAQLAGPRYRAGAFDLLTLAKDAIHGHKMIAEKVREHAARAAEEKTAAAERRGSEGNAAAPGTAGG